MQIINFQPILYLSDGTTLLYRHGKLYIKRCSKIQFLCKLNLGIKEKYLSRIKIISRLLRLGIRCAAQIDQENVIIFVNKHFYELNIQTHCLKDAYIPPIGVRPLNVVNIYGINGFDDSLYFGGYLMNPNSKSVSIYKRISTNQWDIVYSFKDGEITHIHNLVPDINNNCVWILTGDWEQGAAIWKATNNFNKVEPILRGKQEYRSCVAFPTKQGLLYATDTPFHTNSIRLLINKDGQWISKGIKHLPGTCIYGCKIRNKFVFSTCVEPEGINGGKFSWFSTKRGSGIDDNNCHLIVGNIEEGFNDIYHVGKDKLPFALFQFGSLQFPSGNNDSDELLLYHVSTKKNNLKTKILYI